MMYSKLSQDDAGFTIIEALICILLISIGLLAISKMQVKSLRVTQKSSRVITANLESSAAADLLLAMDFNNAALSDGTTATLPSTSGINIQYTVSTVNPFNSSQFYHSILVSTTWTDDIGTHSIQRTLTKLP
jgi:type IV pilus modification protein PilV